MARRSRAADGGADDLDGRRDRFEALVDGNYDRMLGYALRRLREPADAADVVCDVFLVAWRRIDEVPPGDDATLWLYGVARHALANFTRGTRRRRALHARLQTQVVAAAVAGPEPPVSDDLARAVRALSDVTGVELAELCDTLTRTAERVFGTWQPES